MIFGGYQPFSLTDYPGKVAAILFTQGCNFRCPFCHNTELLPLEASPEKIFNSDQALTLLKKRHALLDAVVITGGEPTIQPDLYDFLQQVRTLKLKIKLDTNGCNPQFLAMLLDASLVDYVAMDIKAPEEKYDLLSGTAVHYPAIKESITLLTKSTIPHHFRTTFMQPLLTQNDLDTIRAELPADARYVVQEYQKAP
ncbi:MAG: anaerobic ribonucleoside-triphosphate reductase activating protein [Candidatus Hydrogenedens sp.]|jgi:pyruvate formate lyase activating enzyme|nr:anaerobic ribonucleoside-triphosphate reductase activating protein [Candidatus Hydrogenedens sp.]